MAQTQKAVGDLGRIMLDAFASADSQMAPKPAVKKAAVKKAPAPRLVVNNDKPQPSAVPAEADLVQFKRAIATLYYTDDVPKAVRGNALTAIFNLVTSGKLPPEWAAIAARIFNDARKAGDVSANLRKKILSLYV